MKLYTRRGDSGQTDLFGGERVDKDALRVEAYGTVDEVNCHLGLAAAACQDQLDVPGFDAVADVLPNLQSRLFEIGADLASPREAPDSEEPVAGIARVGKPQTDELEQLIDRFSASVPEMKHFILPGGSEVAARFHVARAICRRAERICVALNKHEPVGEQVIVYLNRLSDLMFALARHANHLLGIADVPWHQRTGE